MSINKNINPRINKTLSIHYTRVFSNTSVLKVDDDIMARLQKLLDMNRDLVNESKTDILIKKRLTMHKNFEDQTNNMAKYLETIGNNMNTGERKQWDTINERAQRMFDLIKEKIDNLNTDDPLHHKNICNLLGLHLNNVAKQQDAMEPIAINAVYRHMRETKADPLSKWAFEAHRTKVLSERNKVLETNKELLEEEKEFFSKKDKESSLIDDFANPNLEQPSYMDPED